MLASKLYEGRVAVLVEGTPFVLYVPYLFSDNFQSLMIMIIRRFSAALCGC